MAITSGTRLGPYEILSPLGAGGMGEVYRAKDPRLGREIALKVLPKEVSENPERLSRFEREARAASALNHPNVITIYEIGQADSAFYIAMELVEGRTLRDHIASGPLPLRVLLNIGSQIADGLAKAHAGGIVHRDLKPENLMVSEDGFVKILDFGLAKLVLPSSDEGSQLPTLGGSQTGLGVVLGTVGYMSPEQASGRALDIRSDQFSLGCVLYEMATGKHAFRKETAAETLTAIIRDEPEPLGSLNARLPAPLCWIVERCLAKDPGKRYASTRDLARDLAELRDRILQAPPQVRGARPVGLPVQRTAFVGRSSERPALRELLQREDVYLVTLTGPGGIGKTRLGLEVAREMADVFPGGVHFVPLAPLNDADRIASTISRVLGVRENAGQAPIDTLTEYLQSSVGAPMLLVLDGFEHLVSAASIVGELVAVGSGLKLLVTSRSPLHLYGEREFPVPPLAVPDPKTATLDALATYESVALFLQRAAAVKPTFALTEESATAIAEICARLDGLPLAIELAAARVKLLSPSAMRTRLESRLQLLTGGARDLPPRQQTLRGAIDWSHDLLNTAEQTLFRRLSVFVDGCTLEAVEAVCNAKNDLALEALDGMASMVDKSLVQQVEPIEGESRFVMLETIREYALEYLSASEDEALARRAHAAYFLVVGEEEGIEGGGQEQAGWLNRFDIEHDNFRAALDWMAQSGKAEWGLRLGAALFRFWEARDHLTEGRDRLTRLLSLPGSAPPTKERARVLFAAGVLAAEQGDFDSARKLLQEALEINRALGDTWGVAVSVNAMAVHALDQGDLASSRSLFEETLALWRNLGDRAAVARSLANLANVVKVAGDHAAALSLYEESLVIFRELGDQTGVAWSLNHQGDVAREQGNVAESRSLYERSLATFRELLDRWGIAGVLCDLGNLARDQGDHAESHSFYRESLAIFQELRHKRGVARLLECFACSAAARGQPARALRLAGAAAALRQAVGAPLPRAEQTKLDSGLEPARRALPDAEVTAAWMEGWATPADKAVEGALADGSA